MTDIFVFVCLSVLVAFAVRSWWNDRVYQRKQLEKRLEQEDQQFLTELRNNIEYVRSLKEAERIKDLAIFIRILNVYGPASPEYRNFWANHKGDHELAISCGVAASLLSQLEDDLTLEKVLAERTRLDA